MPMRWDPLLARAVARELDAALAGRRVRALLLDGERRRVLLYLRDGTLACELHPTAGWISMLGPVDPEPGARPLPARVVGVSALPDESALVFGLQRVRGREEGVELVLEFAGNRWNAVVVGHRSRTIRGVLVSGDARGGARTPGAPWVPLPTGGRAGGPEGPPLSREAFEAKVKGGRGEVLRGVAGASSLNVEALLGPDGWRTLARIHDPEAWGAWITPSPKGRIVYPLALGGAEGGADGEGDAGAEGAEGSAPVATASLLEAIAGLRAEAEAAPAGALLLPGEVLARADDALERLRRRERSLRRELERAPDPAPVRAVGDLLLARFGEVPLGADRAVLTGFDGEPVEVALDPALPVHENARRYYDRAGRAERARAELPARIARVAREADDLAALVGAVRTGEAGVEALEARVGGAAGGPSGGAAGGPAAGRDGGGRDTGVALPYRRFRSSGGLEIRVGRGARKNDDLTFRHSSPGDVWMHVREAPGAHVILRWGRDGNPPARDLHEAAVLAALHSDSRHAGMVPVDWTFRKHVRKPRKAAPGAVVPQQVRTLFVEPDPRVRDRLEAAAEGEGPLA
jgi:hypothetical protein